MNRHIGLAIALLWTIAAAAQEPRIEERDGTRFVSGGVGIDERAALERQARKFNLKMTFAAAQSGKYIADVAVVVRDTGNREILKTDTDGPWLFANLRPGTYTVSATFDGKTQVRRVSILESRRVDSYWYWEGVE